MRVYWETVISRLVELQDPKVIIEIGSDQGANTELLLSVCAPRGRRLHAIDPRPLYDVDAMKDRYGECFQPHLGTSLDVLPTIESAHDMVLIDGDHNWYTVINELRLIGRHAGKHERVFPVVVLHDLAWPYGRRDLYYSPESVPAAQRQPHRKAGVRPGHSELVGAGGLNPHLHNAAYEGGEHNGVLSAVEEFLAETDHELELLTLPVWHGLGIIYSENRIKDNAKLAAYLRELALPDTSRNIMERVEAERVSFMVDIAQHEHRAQRANARIDALSANLAASSSAQADQQRRFKMLTERSAKLQVELAVAQSPLAVQVAGRVLRRVMRVRKPTPMSTSRQVNPVSLGPTVDIVVCVYNALDDVKACLHSVLKNLTTGSRLVIVNDASAGPTSEYLRACAEQHPDDVLLIEHSENRGYTQSVNSGLGASNADYVVLLNSDTIVPPGWAARLVACGESDERIGIVGPLSNAASWQNVPTLLSEDNKFAVNELPAAHSVESFAGLIAATSTRSYPRLPFINGFCFAIKQKLLDAVGIFDANAFPRGYGEENDFCIRAANAGYTLAVADDAYVFHAKSKSFGHADRLKLTEQGKHALESKHGGARVRSLVSEVKNCQELHDVRVRVVAAVTAEAQERILFLLPVAGGGGGAHSVVQEVSAMRRLGVDATIAVPQSSHSNFLQMYRGLPDSAAMFLPFAGDQFVALAVGSSIVVATVYTSMKMLRKICETYPRVMPAYYVQDYEPFFFREGTPDHQEALDSYTSLPGTLLFAKTQWLVETVKERHGVDVKKVSPSLDHDVYKSTQVDDNKSQVRFCAMIRPKTPRRGAARTMGVLGRVQKKHPDKVSIHIFGCDDDEAQFREIARLATVTNHGVLDREGVAAVLADSDVFVDLSDYQAFGRTGLEAMACGCAVVNPKRGGANEYTVDGVNGLLVDTTSEQACVDQLSRLVVDGERRRDLTREGLATAAKYSAQNAATSELAVLREARANYLDARPIRVTALVSRTRGNAPAGSAFVRVIQPYGHRSVAQKILMSLASMDDLLDGSSLSACDVLLIQRDAPRTLERARWLVNFCRNMGIRLVYEIDDLLLSPAAVDARGHKGNTVEIAEVSRHLARAADAIIASTGPLAAEYRSVNETVVIVPNALDEELWQLGKRPLRNSSAPASGNPVRIGYVGTLGHGKDLEVLAPVFDRLTKEYGDRISLEVIGGQQGTPDGFERISLPSDHTYPSFVAWILKRSNWDIGLIPLVDDKFNRAKSYVKWLEYGALGLASVCTDIAPYRDVVRSGENGILVENKQDDWYRAIRSLIDDPDLRASLAEQALADVQRDYTLSSTAGRLVGAYEELWDGPRERASVTGASSPNARIDIVRPETDGDPAIANGQSERYDLIMRRLTKFSRDPRQFCMDSRFSVVRRLGKSGFFRP